MSKQSQFSEFNNKLEPIIEKTTNQVDQILESSGSSDSDDGLARHCPIRDLRLLKEVDDYMKQILKGWIRNQEALRIIHKMHPVFQKFSSIHTCQLIFENSNKLKIKNGSFLYPAGDEKLSFYIVMSGWIHIVEVG